MGVCWWDGGGLGAWACAGGQAGGWAGAGAWRAGAFAVERGGARGAACHRLLAVWSLTVPCHVPRLLLQREGLRGLYAGILPEYYKVGRTLGSLSKDITCGCFVGSAAERRIALACSTRCRTHAALTRPDPVASAGAARRCHCFHDLRIYEEEPGGDHQLQPAVTRCTRLPADVAEQQRGSAAAGSTDSRR